MAEVFGLGEGIEINNSAKAGKRSQFFLTPSKAGENCWV
ncbi:hypothetical protein SAMN04489724_0972 [Algoriphagus locisalis]|uniref:Uncharacterized protein n=1 Tax=Algoriphagus locisalis TaxID=305507 RepID=A0A1I6YEZ0_9BACT|nr:hypothetical protein SAMN04489724_0972 [Algoriphagus locisalis]